MIFLKWPVLRICVEVFGFINLFGDFFPVMLGFLRSMPVVGPVLWGPYIGSVCPPFSGTLSSVSICVCVSCWGLFRVITVVW
jgi:hypothetical protein